MEQVFPVTSIYFFHFLFYECWNLIVIYLCSSIGFICFFQMWFLRTWRGGYWCSHALGLLFLFVHSSSCLPLISFWFFYDLNMSLTWGFKVRSVDFRNLSLQIYGVLIVRDSVHETNCLPTKAIKFIYFIYYCCNFSMIYVPRRSNELGLEKFISI